MRPPENFAAGVWASLQSGYALLARRPDTRILSTNPAELPLKDSETVFKQTRPPLEPFATSVDNQLTRHKTFELVRLFDLAGSFIGFVIE